MKIHASSLTQRLGSLELVKRSTWVSFDDEAENCHAETSHSGGGSRWSLSRGSQRARAKAMGALLDAPQPPTAVFASSDEMAMGFLEACESLAHRCRNRYQVTSARCNFSARGQRPSARRRVAGRRSVELVTQIGLGAQPAYAGRVAVELVARSSIAPPSNALMTCSTQRRTADVQ